ncbi:MAG TPA: DNA helicase [Lapillicoccus sp.]|nr:DNA helicase [Lapillicoccus sp.]
MSPGPFESDATRPPERVEAVAAALAGWRRQLSTLGGANTLLWYVEQPTGVLDLTTAHPGGISMLLAGRPTRLSDLVRERGAFAEARARAAEIRGRALALRAERGLETSFFAAGMATWEHPGAPTPPHAPILLRTCTLRPTDAVASDFDVVLGSEVEVNPVLEQYLRSTAGIDIDAAALAEMTTLSSGFDPYPVYAALARLCEGLPGFAVTPRVLVGTFPYGKLAMVGDLAELAEPAAVERLAGHPVLSALAGGFGGAATGGGATGGAATAARIPVEPAADLDPDPDPAGERLVLDADAAQSAVVEAVLRGEDVVVEAPPGTGSTQTVANIVAALAGQRNSVLLVAQRPAELEDVRRRLESVGLGSMVADLGSGLFDHRGTLAEVVALVDAPGADESWADRLPVEGSRLENRLRSQRDALRDHVAALHEVRTPWGVSVHEAQCAISELGSRSPAPASRVRIRGAALARLSRERLHELADELSGAVAVGAWASGEAGDAWYGARVTSEEEVARASAIVTRLADGGLDERAATLDEILAESSLPAARTVRDWGTALTTMAGVRETLEVFRPEIFDVPLDEHVAATGTREYRRDHGVELGWWARSRVRRLATRLLRPGRPPEDLHAELVRARVQRTAWHALVGAGGRPEISPRLDEAQDAYEDLDADLTWLGERLASTAAGGDLQTTPVAELRTRLAALASRPDRLAVLPAVVPVIDDLRAAGMGEVVDDFAARGVAADEVTAELEHIWWVSIVRHVTDSDPRYGQHDGTALRAAAEGYAAADREHLTTTARRTRLEAGAWHASVSESNRTAAAMLRAEADRAGRPMALRSAFEASADLLLGAAPCWAMSPLVVGEALPPGPWFDVVVVVGAGSLPTAAAVSALSRGRQVVAVGDAGSSWPTAFTAGAAQDEVDTAPSLLEDLGGTLPVHRLRWAHGYADARLVRVAGGEEGDELVAPASPWPVPAVGLELVDGRASLDAGDEATIDSTDAEVDRVVALVLEHARNRPHESLGVVTLTERHAERIRWALAATAGSLDVAAEPELLAYLDAEAPRPVAIVALPTASGLARDAVILSVGYGKTPHGRVLHRFPALSAADAPRQLRAALTAARQRLTVVSSIGPDELDESRLRDGGLTLRDLLAGAAGGGPSPLEESAGSPDPLMTELAGRLRREGLVVAEGVGTGPHRVDIAVTVPAHPDRWLLAVEGDGPGYARWRGTRERDRLWPQELERRGWRHLRVWSTDLYRDPARDVARIVTTTWEVARALGVPTTEPEGAVEEAPESESADVDAGEESASPDSGAEPDGASATEPAPETEPAPDTESTAEAEPTADAETKPTAETETAPETETEPKPESAVAPTEGGTRKRRRRAFRRGTTTAEGAAGQTVDDTDAGWGERRDDGAHETWLRDQRPPHWE